MDPIGHNLATCRACRSARAAWPDEHPAVPRCPEDGDLLTAHAAAGACGLGKLRATAAAAATPAADPARTSVPATPSPPPPSDPTAPPLPVGLSLAQLPPPPPQPAPAPDPAGAGNQLHAILADFGFDLGVGCSCRARIAQMNQWGPTGCEANLPTILRWLKDAFEREVKGVPFEPGPIELVVREAILRAIMAKPLSP